MKFKRLLASAMASVLALTGVLTFASANDILVKAEDVLSLENKPIKHVFETYGTSSAFFIDVNKSFNRGKNGEILKITAIDNGTTINSAISITAEVPKLDGNGYSYLKSTLFKNKGIENESLTWELPIADYLESITHTSTATGIKGTPAGNSVTRLRIFMVGTSSVPSRIKDNTITLEVIKPAPQLACEVKYQQKIESPNDIRFIGIADEEQIKAATSAKAALSVAGYDDPDNFIAAEGSPETITKAYKSIVANGQKIEAEDGKCFLVTSSLNVPDGDKAKAVFSIDGLAGESERTVQIGNVPDSSSEEESSSQPDSSSEEESSSEPDSSSEDDGAKVIWTGETDLGFNGGWKTECTIGSNLQFWGEGTKLTVNYTPTTPSTETVFQLVAKVGSGWKWTELYSEVKIPAGSTSYTFNLTDDDMAILASSDCKAIIIKGENAVVTSAVVTGENNAPKENEWTDNEDGSYTFYWTNASGKPDNDGELKIPLTGYNKAKIKKITVELEASDYANGAIGVSANDNPKFTWTAKNYDFKGAGTDTIELEPNGVSSDDLSIKVFWANKGVTLKVKSITISE